MQMITIKAMLEYMQTGQSFSCTYVTYDRTRSKKKPFSKRVEIGEAILVQATPHSSGGLRMPTKVEHLKQQLSGQSSLSGDLGGKRNPNHSEHYTRNVRLCVNGHPTAQIRKIHPPLVIKFNEKTVVP